MEIVDLISCTSVLAKIERGKEAGASHMDVSNSMPSNQKLVAKTDSQEGKAGSVGNEG